MQNKRENTHRIILRGINVKNLSQYQCCFYCGMFHEAVNDLRDELEGI
jgi:hypothetical protein